MTRTKMLKGSASAFVFSIASAGMLATAAEARDLRYAIGWPPGALPTEALEQYATAVEEASGGDVTVKVYPLSLLNFLESTSGVRDGIADMTTVLTPYFLSEFPATNFATELASLSEVVEGDPDRMSFAFSGALMEYVMFNCEGCQEEFAAQNHVYTSAAGTPPYMLQCTKPIVSVEDLKGTRIRTPGAFWSRWIEAMDAIPVSISINETFEALNQGVIDCSASSASELTNFSFKDVVTDITSNLPGSSFVSGLTNVNADTWRGLDDAGRTALLKGSAVGAAQMNWAYYSDARDNIAGASEQGITFHEADDALRTESVDWIKQDIDDLIGIYAERGVENGDAGAEKIRELMNKWVSLVADVGDAQQLSDLYWTEILSKVDVATYGQ